MTMPSSNNPVECVFSILTAILIDQLLTMAHKTMEDCILIDRNKNSWNK